MVQKMGGEDSPISPPLDPRLYIAWKPTVKREQQMSGTEPRFTDLTAPS